MIVEFLAHLGSGFRQYEWIGACGLCQRGLARILGGGHSTWNREDSSLASITNSTRTIIFAQEKQVVQALYEVCGCFEELAVGFLEKLMSFFCLLIYAFLSQIHTYGLVDTPKGFFLTLGRSWGKKRRRGVVYPHPAF